MNARARLAWMMIPLSLGYISAAFACSVSEIQIKQATLVHRGPSGRYSVVVGELFNGCSDAAGVQIHITLRDKAGQVISTGDSWPAGTHNIPPHTSYSFTVNADEEGRPAERLQVEVTEVHKW